MDELAIGEVARRTGLQPSALRYYESIGLLPPPERSSGRRIYRQDTLGRIRLIQVAKRAGFTMAEIQALFHDFAPDTPPAVRWQALATGKLAELEQLAAAIEQMRVILHRGLECGCLRLDDCAALLEDGCEQQ
jgi:MerR family transcriptional regulator, redox-sensitive transcriptional activator SoxR